MKYKKIIFYFSVIVLVFVIFNITKSNKLNIIILGDSISNSENSYGEKIYGYTDYLYNYYSNKNLIKNYHNFSSRNNSLLNLISDIENNKYNLKRSLRESDLLFIEIGMLDIFNNISNGLNYFDESSIKDNLKQMIKTVRKYAKNDIVLLGYFNSYQYSDYNKEVIDKLIININKYLNQLCKKNSIKYIDLFDIINDKKYFDNPHSFNINYLGHKSIYYEIRKYI